MSDEKSITITPLKENSFTIVSPISETYVGNEPEIVIVDIVKDVKDLKPWNLKPECGYWESWFTKYVLSCENDRTAVVAERALDFFGYNYGDCFGKLIYFVESALRKIGLAKGGYVNDVAELFVIEGVTKNKDTHALLGIKKPHYTLILEISPVPNYTPFVVFLDHKAEDKAYVSKFCKNDQNDEKLVIVFSKGMCCLETLISITIGDYFFKKTTCLPYENCRTRNSDFFKEACQALMMKGKLNLKKPGAKSNAESVYFSDNSEEKFVIGLNLSEIWKIFVISIDISEEEQYAEKIAILYYKSHISPGIRIREVVKKLSSHSNLSKEKYLELLRKESDNSV